ncbi:DUF5765 domain-containing protein [Methylocapsa polymorpha]|uniref:DUF5765 domain-containing protein n=1 Tax=Methylocapsa polymorpha TaxID=3080828 RepID=A0ABZ0HSJ1_9HYPH|nr:DUF5765 domain-containing protein [Methylocapsa sp. RX1]
MAAIGVATAAHAALKRHPEPAALWACLLYFSSMEVLQAVSYTVVNQCDNPLNQFLTLLGYLHITFQPFFINAGALYFMPKDVARRVAPWAYFFCFIAALSMLIQLYPFQWAGTCALGRPICGQILCTARGSWHLAWFVPLNGIGNAVKAYSIFGNGFVGYSVTAFLMPLLYGSWRVVLFTYLAGPLLAFLTTSNPNEFPAVWCLYSIALCLTIIKTPLRRHLRVETPYWRIIAAWLRRIAVARQSSVPVSEGGESTLK